MKYKNKIQCPLCKDIVSSLQETSAFTGCIKCFRSAGIQVRKDLLKERQLQNRYGITIAQFKKMLEDQEYNCALCKKKLDLQNPLKTLVDHCHRTNKVRGIVCSGCNTWLGVIDKVLTRHKNNLLDKELAYIRQFDSDF